VGTTPGKSEPRFPGYDVTAQAHTWDETTTRVVLRRLTPPTARFFTPDEEPTARALMDRLLGQDHEPRVPVFELVDERLAERAGDGYRYSDMPEDPEAWRASLAFLDDDAASVHGDRFDQLGRRNQLRQLEDIRTTSRPWHGLPGQRVFSLWVRYCCTAFYSHPWAWNEIGFGGPAYPRGYKNLGIGRREPWEVSDHDAEDPVPWAERVEAARDRHRRDLASEGPS
jgi:hypothetical protein